MRYSVAFPYNIYAPRTGMKQGISLKLFRDGTHSANTVAMNSFDGTETPNFFETNFRTHLKEPKYDIFV
jgi:hypothetical protein